MNGLLRPIRHNGNHYAPVLASLNTKMHNNRTWWGKTDPSLCAVIELVKDKVNRERAAVFIQAAFRGFCGRKIAAFEKLKYKKTQPMSINEWRNEETHYQTTVAVRAVEEACVPYPNQQSAMRMAPEVGTAYVGYWDNTFQTISATIMDGLGFLDARLLARAEMMVMEKLVEMNDEFQAMVQNENMMEDLKTHNTYSYKKDDTEFRYYKS